jgi:hypothetical protein
MSRQIVGMESLVVLAICFLLTSLFCRIVPKMVRMFRIRVDEIPLWMGRSVSMVSSLSVMGYGSNIHTNIFMLELLSILSLFICIRATATQNSK